MLKQKFTEKIRKKIGKKNCETKILRKKFWKKNFGKKFRQNILEKTFDKIFWKNKLQTSNIHNQNL